MHSNAGSSHLNLIFHRRYRIHFCCAIRRGDRLINFIHMSYDSHMLFEYKLYSTIQGYSIARSVPAPKRLLVVTKVQNPTQSRSASYDKKLHSSCFLRQAVHSTKVELLMMTQTFGIHFG